MASDRDVRIEERQLRMRLEDVSLTGTLARPADAEKLVLLVSGSGGDTGEARSRVIASELRRAGLATLTAGLLTDDEERSNVLARSLRFDIDLLAGRIAGVSRWLAGREDLRELKVGYYGASTRATSVLKAAAELGDDVFAVVCQGGRPDLTSMVLPRIKSPTLLIVGGNDIPVIGMNQNALASLRGTADKDMVIVQGASHLFKEPGKLEQAAAHAAEWFLGH